MAKHLVFFITLFLCVFIFSCSNHRHSKVYRTTDRDGYCYNDNGLWYIYYATGNGNYYYYGTSGSTYSSYDNTTPVTWTPSNENVANFNEMSEAAQSSVSDLSENTGESVEGTSDQGSTPDGVSESTGESSGGSESSGSGDSGGGDGGGGE